MGRQLASALASSGVNACALHEALGLRKMKSAGVSDPEGVGSLEKSSSLLNSQKQLAQSFEDAGNLAISTKDSLTDTDIPPVIVTFEGMARGLHLTSLDT